MKTRRRRWLIAGGVTLLLVAIVAMSLPNELDACIARLEAAGEPVTFEQVVAPAWDPEENAAVDLLVILDEFIAVVDAGAGRAAVRELTPWADLPESEREAVTAMLVVHEERLRRVRELVLARRFRFDSRGLADRLGAVGSPVRRAILDVSCLLRRSADVQLAAPDEAADPEALLQTLETICALGRAWEPITFTDVMHLSNPDYAASHLVRQALADGRLDAVQAHGRLEPLLRRSRRASWGLTQRANRAVWLDTYEEMLDRETDRVPVGWTFVPRGTSLDLLKQIAVRTSIEAKFALQDALVDLDDTSDTALRAGMDHLIATHQDSRLIGAAWIQIDPASDARFLDLITRTDTDLDLARVALAAAAHRAKAGEWPNATSELVALLGGEEPLDSAGLPNELVVTPEGDLTIHATQPRGSEPLPEWRLPR